MRHPLTARLCAAVALIALPALAHADAAADIVKIFGRDPGMAAAHACFLRHYTKAHLASHPKQNVTDMIVYVGKDEGSDHNYSVSMQVNFRQLRKPFQVSGFCGVDANGKKTLSCGIECDGGHIDVRVKSDMSLLIEIPEHARIFDPADLESDDRAEVPDKARFGADDKIFRVDRTALKDCTPVIYDESIKASVIKGTTTQ
jgi:hypothetical protein